MKKETEFIARCDPHGKMEGNITLLREQVEEEACANAYIEDDMEYLRAQIAQGKFCMEIGMHRDAMFIFESLLEQINWNCKGEKKALLEETADYLVSLSHCMDDYVWESVTSSLEEYREWRNVQQQTGDLPPTE